MAAHTRIVVGANGDQPADRAGATTSRTGTVAGAGNNRDRADPRAGADAVGCDADANAARVQLQLLRARHRDELDGPGDRAGLLRCAAIGGGRLPQLQRAARAAVAASE